MNCKNKKKLKALHEPNKSNKINKSTKKENFLWVAKTKKKILGHCMKQTNQ